MEILKYNFKVFVLKYSVAMFHDLILIIFIIDSSAFPWLKHHKAIEKKIDVAF